MIFASFVRKREHVEDIRKALGDSEIGKTMKIIAKIENLEGVQHFDEILDGEYKCAHIKIYLAHIKLLHL